jgi:hypothetical protein
MSMAKWVQHISGVGEEWEDVSHRCYVYDGHITDQEPTYGSIVVSGRKEYRVLKVMLRKAVTDKAQDAFIIERRKG